MRAIGPVREIEVVPNFVFFDPGPQSICKENVVLPSNDSKAGLYFTLLPIDMRDDKEMDDPLDLRTPMVQCGNATDAHESQRFDTGVSMVCFVRRHTASSWARRTPSI